MLVQENPTTQWLDRQREASLRFMVANIHAPGTLPGTVVASTSGHYFYHWVRDASLVMRQVLRMRGQAPANSVAKNHYSGLLRDFLQLSRDQQLLPTRGGLGEPKFNVNGTAYMLDWARPQNDGPATRALFVAEWAEQLLAEGASLDDVRQQLLLDVRTAAANDRNAAYVWSADISYLLYHWREESAEVWEEVIARSNFYTLLSFRAAFSASRSLAQRLQSHDLVASLDHEIAAIDERIQQHWLPAQGFFTASLELRRDHYDFLKNGLDASSVLAALYFTTDAVPLMDARVLKTADRLERMATRVWPHVNTNVRAPVIGRYEHDAWDGMDRRHPGAGNPWFLVTAGMAELHYRVAKKFADGLDLSVVQQAPEFYEGLNIGSRRELVNDLLSRGDAFLERVREYAGPNGELSEQMSQHERGRAVGPANLTWSHLALLRADEARMRVLQTTLQR